MFLALTRHADKPTLVAAQNFEYKVRIYLHELGLVQIMSCYQMSNILDKPLESVSLSWGISVAPYCSTTDSRLYNRTTWSLQCLSVSQLFVSKVLLHSKCDP